MEGASTALQPVKPPLGTPTSHVRVPVQVPGPPFPILLHATVSGKAVDVDPSAQVLASHVGDPDKVLGSWPWLGYGGHLGSETVEDLSLPYCHSFK